MSTLLSAGISCVQELAFRIVWRWFTVRLCLFGGAEAAAAACGASAGSAVVYVYGVQVDLRCAVMKLSGCSGARWIQRL